VKYWKAVHILLSSVSHLRFMQSVAETPSSILVALVNHSRHSLQSLHMSCSHIISLHPLGHFSCLSDLSLMWSTWCSVPEWVLKLPTVTSILIGCYVIEPTPEDFLEYLAKSRFHPSCRLELDLDRMDIRRLGLLEPLFRSYIPEHVKIEGLVDFHPALFACTENLSIDCVPPPASFRGKLPARLSLCLNFAKMPALHAVLDVLASLPKPGSVVHRLQIMPDGLEDDWWNTEVPGYRKDFESKMCEYEGRLAGCGVHLLGPEGIRYM
jgi:hypothetical protein